MSWWMLVEVARADTCDAWGEAEVVAEVDGAVSESSGVAAARTREGVFFTHGDKNSSPDLVAFNLEGQVLETHEVTGGTYEDWEDLAAAPCPDEGDCLYLADIGDNDLDRDSISVLVLREPQPGQKAKVVRRWEMVYPDGPRDAEALIVHPCTGGVHVLTKEDDGRATVFRLPADPSAGINTLEEVAQFSLPGPTAESRRVTGASYDVDGDRVAVRTLDSVWEWDVDPEAPNGHWGGAPREIVGVAEEQGEAITYGLDGALYTTTEGAPMAIGRVVCEGVTPSDHACDFPYETGCGCASAPRSVGGAWVGAALGWVLRRRARRR